MSKKNNGQAQGTATQTHNAGKMNGKGPHVEATAGTGAKGKGAGGQSHGPVASFDMERAKKELEKNRIEFRIENGELVTFDHGDAKARTMATQVVANFKRKAG